MAVADTLPTPSPRVASPDDISGRTELWKNTAGYLGVVVVSLAALTVLFDLWRTDLSVPFYYSTDNLFHLMLVQTVLEEGWYLNNTRLGMPTGLNVSDFPMPDVLHYAVIKLLGYVCPGAGLVQNLYYILQFPLIALAAYFALRRLRVGRLTGLVAAVLYAFLPYHLVRLQGHLCLTGYYLVPLLVLIVIRVGLGRYPFLHTGDDGRARWRFVSWGAAGAALVCVLTGVAGAYYAFFSCFFLLAVGVRSAFRERRAAPLWVAAVLILLTAGSLGVAMLPTFLHTARWGKNPAALGRAPAEADLYGLSVSEMLLPVEGHRLARLHWLRQKFLAPPRTPTGEHFATPLGVVASLGLLWLVGRFLWRRPGPTESVEDTLAYLTVAAVLLGTVGGFGAAFNFYVTPQIRCYNRISIFIGFFALAALALLVRRWAARRAVTPRARAAGVAGLVLVLVLGLLDQTPLNIILASAEARQQYESDADFGRRLEAELPAGAMVYQLPHVFFPEGQPVQRLQGGYELFRPYFHTRTPALELWGHEGPPRQPVAGRTHGVAASGGAAGVDRGRLSRPLPGPCRLRR